MENSYLVCNDVALRKSGYVILDPHGKIVYKNTLVIPKVDLTQSISLLDKMFTKEFRYALDNFPGPFEYVVEDVLAVVHMKTALGIHASRVISVLAWIKESGSEEGIHYYSPNTIKYNFAKKRGAKKDELLAALRLMYPDYDYDNMTEDEVDALALGLHHRQNTPQKEVLNVKKPVRRTKRK